ncbi:hypothetical protein QQP08_025196 [Theobroma cacao]|nr:hypothetical protein QQP08_025196 [Theobroma cacao]
MSLNRYFDYLFYVDFEASMADPRAQNALRHLKEFATFLRVLGSSIRKGYVLELGWRLEGGRQREYSSILVAIKQQAGISNFYLSTTLWCEADVSLSTFIFQMDVRAYCCLFLGLDACGEWWAKLRRNVVFEQTRLNYFPVGKIISVLYERSDPTGNKEQVPTKLFTLLMRLSMKYRYYMDQNFTLHRYGYSLYNGRIFWYIEKTLIQLCTAAINSQATALQRRNADKKSL